MKTFTLFKRDATGCLTSPYAPGFRDQPWHSNFEFRGKRCVRSLETTDSAEAPHVPPQNQT
jgi:hypothetical protein